MAILTLRAVPDPAQPPDTLLAIPDGPAGIAVTLAYMVAWARQYKTDPAMRALARQIIASVPEKNWTAEADAIRTYVRNTIRYTQDVYGVESLQTPPDTLQFGQGDCDDQALLVATLLLAAGHPARFVAFAFNGPGEYEHVYTETLIGSRWYGLETTEAGAYLGWRPETNYSTMIRTV